MSIASAVGYGVGRLLHLGVHGEWSAFKRGVGAATICAIAGATGAATLAIQHWDEIRSMFPQPAPPPGSHRVAGRVDSYHQCYVRGTANGAPFTFLLDTGASILSFNRDHAKQLGLRPDELHYDQRTMTANGVGRSAFVRLRELRLGDFVLKDVLAMVDYDGADPPLLGASVLKFMHVNLQHGTCSLTW